MTRDELILYFIPVVENVVKKYNNHEIDEDLVSIGTLKCIKAVDRCLSENVTDVDAIRPRVIVWVKNAVLDAISLRNNSNKIDCLDDYEVTDNSELDILIFDVRESLNGKTKDVFDLKLSGYTKEEICEKLNIKKTQYFEYLKRIKKVITEQN